MSRNMRGGAKPALWVSQNFLTGRAVIRRILDQAALSKTDHVVEIGPGKGHITAALAQRCGRVSAVELDGRLYERLCRTFPAGGPVRLYHQDFLTWPLPKSDYVVFANIPFSITSAILRRLTQGSHPPREAWLVMEKGAAKRYMGRPALGTASGVHGLLRTLFRRRSRCPASDPDPQPADGGSARCGPATGFPLGRYAVCPMALPVPMGRTVRQNRRLASSTWNGGIRAY